jgi:phosphohistidine phosphatase SixA
MNCPNGNCVRRGLFGYKEGKNANFGSLNTVSQNPLTVLFFTHQHRLISSVVKTFNRFLQQQQQQIDPKVRFMNGAIIQCLIQPQLQPQLQQKNYKLSIQLIYDGELDDTSDKENKPYWTKIEDNATGGWSENFGQDENVFPKLSIKYRQFNPRFNIFLTSQDLFTYFKINEAMLGTYDSFYLFFIRHGDAEHNTKQKINMGIGKLKYGNVKANTDLTPKGKIQAINSGRAFSQYLNTSRLLINKIDFIALSDLIRTQQTAGSFLEGIKSATGNNRLLEGTRAVVLPCLHELQSGTDDGSISVLQGLGNITSAATFGATSGIALRENITNCQTNDPTKGRNTSDRFTGRNAEQSISSVTDAEFSIANQQIYTQQPSQCPQVGYNSNGNIKDCTNICYNGINIPIDWSFYLDFYGGDYRNRQQYRTTFRSKRSCTNSHFIGLFFEYLNLLDTDSASGLPLPLSSSWKQKLQPGSSQSRSRFFRSRPSWNPFARSSNSLSMSKQTDLNSPLINTNSGRFDGGKYRNYNKTKKAKKIKKTKKAKKSKKVRKNITRKRAKTN